MNLKEWSKMRFRAIASLAFFVGLINRVFLYLRGEYTEWPLLVILFLIFAYCFVTKTKRIPPENRSRIVIPECIFGMSVIIVAAIELPFGVNYLLNWIAFVLVVFFYFEPTFKKL